MGEVPADEGRTSGLLAERAGEARTPARGGDRPVPARLRGRGPRWRRFARPTTASRPGEETEAATGSPGGSRPAAASAGRRSSTSSTAPAASSSTRGRTILGRGRASSDWWASTSATSSASTGPPSRPRGELSLRLRRLDRCWRRACGRRPEKFHGLADVETRYRRRELDLIANPEVRRALPAARAAIVTAMRRCARRSRLHRGRDARSCSRSTAARWRGRSRPTTTRSTATSTCGSRPSST